jgi:hypothetical protein
VDLNRQLSPLTSLRQKRSVSEPTNVRYARPPATAATRSLNGKRKPPPMLAENLVSES